MQLYIANTHDATMLPSNPLFCTRNVIDITEAELLVWVVVSYQIHEDCGRLKNGKLLPIVIYDCWDAYATMVSGRGSFSLLLRKETRTTVWRVSGKPRLLLDVLHNVNILVNVVQAICFFEFFEQDGYFDTVGGIAC